MATTEQRTKPSKLTDDDLRRMVIPDPVRPGPATYRVFIDEDMHLPIWPIMGQLLFGHGWDPDSKRPQVDTILTVAREYDIPSIAVEAAILYYHEHRGAIDALHAANEAE